MSSIEWTDAAWNPVTGCSRVSPGCKNCYAEKMAWRLMHMPATSQRYADTVRKTKGGARQWTGKINLAEEALNKPLKLKKPTMFFVNSMSDLFHPDIPTDYLMRIWEVMKACPQHTFQVLTKRPEEIPARLPADWGNGYRNVWLGVSVENQDYTWRVDRLSEIPAAIRFISAEPLIGEVYDMNLLGIDWVIVGGESGPGARPCYTAWIGAVIGLCLGSDVPVFVKQLGSSLAKMYELKDKKGGTPEEWPRNWQVFNRREFPKSKII